MKNIRNFCIIAHIDHGKSTLSDRMLELTGTIESRKMKDQVLDSMELERERGITIKMQPVRMQWKDTVLNLIDTPGHIDFSYEVSRALHAVEGAILLVDSTQSIQAQTLSVLAMARSQGLTIIPALSKIDSNLARVQEVKKEVALLLNCEEDSIIETSGRTGRGVDQLLNEVVEKIPAPSGEEDAPLKALIFDFKYSTHTGISVFVRIFSGKVSARENLIFRIAGESFTSLEVGTFSPAEIKRESLTAGEIGYIVTGIKSPGTVSVGDTVGKERENAEALPGYEFPNPVVWASIFPEDQNDFKELKTALSKLKLSDSSLFYEEESSGILGKGYRCGFLGMLHLEIVSERLKREFDLPLVITQPSITFDVEFKDHHFEKIFSPSFFPEDGQILKVEEPWVRASIIVPRKYSGGIMPLLHDYEAELEKMDNFGDERAVIKCLMPLRELMRGFFDKLKSVSQGYASLSYEETGKREASVTKLAILIGGDEEPSLSKIVSSRTAEHEAEAIVEKLRELLPRQMFELKIQAKISGRIVASRTLSAFRKDVTQHMYGGDITRKMKLREKQKKGKKKMKERGRISIPHDVFIKLMKP